MLGESGRALIELAERADPAEVPQGEYRGEPYALPVAVVYVQAVTHATEHRSQVATILSRRGVEPSDLSG